MVAGLPSKLSAAPVLLQLISWLSTYFNVQPLSGISGGMTVSITVVLWVMPPPLAVTVMGYVPTATLLATAILITELLPAVVSVDGLKVTLTPAGWPEALSPMALLKPLIAVVAMLELPDP